MFPSTKPSTASSQASSTFDNKRMRSSANIDSSDSHLRTAS